jgi:hypothetical protein
MRPHKAQLWKRLLDQIEVAGLMGGREMAYELLMMTSPRIERQNHRVRWQGKTQSADVALGPLEREGWMELGKD